MGDGAQWRGWATGPGDTGVTSTRLGTGAPVQNRMFPKVRSWFALGAPLELLSPLSVARIVFLAALVVELVAAGGSTGTRPAAVLAVLVANLAVVARLLRAKELSPRACHVLAVLAVAGVAATAWAGDGQPRALAAVLLLLPVAVFAGLFFALRTLLWLQLAQTAALTAVLPFTGLSVGDAVLLATVTGVGTLATALTIALTTRSARRQGTIDADTGLPNGYGLAELLPGRVRDGRFVVATLVLRGLAEAREALGYRAGTELLRRAVEDLGQVLPAAALIGRVDGDELVVAEPGDDGTALADQLARGIGSGRYLVNGVEVMLRAHVGLAVAPDDGTDVTELIRRASLTARRALASGQSHARWDGATGALTGDDLALLADLRTAPERNELWVAYQPQIEPATGRTIGVEALLRWTSPTHGAVSPGVFIPLAERTGLVDRLTDWVLAEVLDAQVRWRKAGLDLRASVNLSAMSLSDPTLPDRILAELRTRALPSRALAIEVTETAAVDAAQAVDRLRPLHDQGVRVAIDDFGTGYTSLSVLPHLPLDELKVDQRFVIASSTSSADEAIVEAVCHLAHRLGLDVVAEGVEDEATGRRLAAMGYDGLQGFHYARPLPEPELLAFVARVPRAVSG